MFNTPTSKPSNAVQGSIDPRREVAEGDLPEEGPVAPPVVIHAIREGLLEAWGGR